MIVAFVTRAVIECLFGDASSLLGNIEYIDLLSGCTGVQLICLKYNVQGAWFYAKIEIVLTKQEMVLSDDH